MKTYEVLTEGWIDGSYSRKGERLTMPGDAAKWLILGGQIKEIEEAGEPAAGPANPLDHDGDDKAGGSLPASDLGDLSAAGLAVAAELGEVDFNTLRTTAKRFLGNDVPAKKADIIAALNKVESGA